MVIIMIAKKVCSSKHLFKAQLLFDETKIKELLFVYFVCFITFIK